MENFFNYFPVAPKDRGWGLHASSFGHVRVAPGAPYPPNRHPDNHHFIWDQGRILQDYQLIYIHEGTGLFESNVTKPLKLTQGNAFLLFPGVWHRYRPELSTGWRESWIELSGSYIDLLKQNTLIDPKRPIYQIESVDEVESLLERALALTRSKHPAFAIRLGLIAIQILTLARSGSSRPQAVSRRIVDIISQAQILFSKNSDHSMSPSQIARKIGISYSYFRREFKQQTGFSPKQYLIEIRLRHVKELLRNTSLTIKEISEKLGYSSPYHLTLDFSKSTGTPPSRWRVEASRSFRDISSV